MKHKSNAARNSGLKKLSKLIEGIETAMLTTREHDGTLHSRPMKTEAVQPEGVILFFTDGGSAKALELKGHDQVSLTYVAKKAAVCVAIAGRGRIVRDKAKMKELWSPVYKAWFPKGLEDPDLSLLEVTIERAEYWENPSNPMARLVGAAMALVTGRPVGEELGDHRKMSL
jgi:general stress protein 26